MWKLSQIHSEKLQMVLKSVGREIKIILKTTPM